MKRMLMLGALLLSASCVTIDGRLEVKEALNVKKKSGFLNLKTKEIALKPGIYSAELKAVSDSNFTLKVSGGALKDEIAIPLKSEKDLNVPSNGAFHIAGSQIEQPFNVSGTINTKIEHYGYGSKIVECSIYVKEERCEKVCDKEKKKCDVVCKEITRSIPGEKEVDFHDKRTTRDLTLELSGLHSTALLASLVGRSVEVDRITDRESRCERLRHRW